MKTAITLLIVLLLCCPTYALTFMGAPKSNLEQGKYGFGIDYSHSDIDVEISGLGVSFSDDFETNTVFTNFGYGITDMWEGFIRLGMVKIEADGFEGDNEFAYGFGTKLTLTEQDSVSWGTILQISWLKGNDTILGIVPPYGFIVADEEIDIYELQIAFGPTFETDGFEIYGGPFFHFIDGDYDLDIVSMGSGSFDIEEESVIGGYVGMSIELTSNSDIGFEYQFTGDADALGVRYVYRF